MRCNPNIKPPVSFGYRIYNGETAFRNSSDNKKCIFESNPERQRGSKLAGKYYWQHFCFQFILPNKSGYAYICPETKVEFTFLKKQYKRLKHDKSLSYTNVSRALSKFCLPDMLARLKKQYPEVEQGKSEDGSCKTRLILSKLLILALKPLKFAWTKVKSP